MVPYTWDLPVVDTCTVVGPSEDITEQVVRFLARECATGRGRYRPFDEGKPLTSRFARLIGAEQALQAPYPGGHRPPRITLFGRPERATPPREYHRAAT